MKYECKISYILGDPQEYPNLAKISRNKGFSSEIHLLSLPVSVVAAVVVVMVLVVIADVVIHLCIFADHLLLLLSTMDRLIAVHPSPIPPRRKSKKPRVETPKLNLSMMYIPRKLI